MEENKSKKVKIIILDTNFLMQPAKIGLDIFDEIDKAALFNYELAIIDETINELNRLCESRGKQKAEAKLAKALIKAKGLKIISTDNVTKAKNADDRILFTATQNPYKYMVATQDKALKKRLKSKGVKTITIRQKKYAIIEE